MICIYLDALRELLLIMLIALFIEHPSVIILHLSQLPIIRKNSLLFYNLQTSCVMWTLLCACYIECTKSICTHIRLMMSPANSM